MTHRKGSALFSSQNRLKISPRRREGEPVAKAIREGKTGVVGSLSKARASYAADYVKLISWISFL